MSKFISLTRVDKHPVAINVDKIVEIVDWGNERIVANCTTLNGKRNYGCSVVETMSEILKKIEDTNK